MSAVTIAVNLIATNGTGGAFNSLGTSILSTTGRLRGLLAMLQEAGAGLGGFGLATLTTGALFNGFNEILQTGVTQAADLEQGLLRLRFATQENASDMPLLTAAVTDLAVQTMFGVTEATGAFERLTEMGFSTKEILYGLGDGTNYLMDGTYHAAEAMNGLGMQALFLGQALKADPLEAAQLLGATLHTFEADGMSAGEAANYLAAAFFNGVPDVNLLAQAIRNGGSTAAAVGVNFKDFIVMMDLLSQAGLPANQAATSLNYYISQLSAPTTKAAKALADLGLVTINTGPKFDAFASALRRSGSAGAGAVHAFDGTVTSLQAMYKAGQAAGLISLDKSFNAWAIQAGIMNNKMYDAQGNFIGLKDSALLIQDALGKVDSQASKLGYIRDIFNIRGGQDARLLASMSDFGTKYDALAARFKKTDLAQLASDQLNTLAGATDQLKDTFLTALSVAFLPLLPIFTDLVSKTAELISKFQELDPKVQAAAGISLILLVVLTGISTVVLGLITGIVALLAIGVSLSTVFAVFAAVMGSIIVYIIPIVLWALSLAQALKDNKDAQKAVNDALDHMRKALEDLKPHWEHLQESLVKLKPYWDEFVKLAGTLAVLFAVNLINSVTGFLQFLGWLFDRIADGIDLWTEWQTKLHEWGVAIRKFFEELPTKAKQALDDLLAKAGQAKDAVIQKIQELANGVKQKIEDGFNAAKAKVEEIIDGVVSKFEWLYNHNYYFQYLVDFIHTKIEEIKQKFEDFKAKAGAIWEALKLVIQQKVREAWDWVTSRFDQGKKDTTNKFEELKNQALAIWNLLWTMVQSKFNEAKNKVLGVFDDWKSKALEKANELKKNILDPIINLGADMYKWGQNALKQLIDGVSSKIGDLKKKIGEAAGEFAKLLGFHSPPPEGPLADSDQYMPNMMDMYAAGIESKLPDLRHRIGTVASTLVVTPQAVGQTHASASYGGTIVIPINLGNRQVAEYTLDLATRKLRQSGSTRYAR